MNQQNFYIPKEFHGKAKTQYSMNFKLNSEGNYSIKFFDKNNGIHLHKIQIKRLLPKELENVRDYFEECKLFGVDIEEFNFSNYREIKKIVDMMNEESLLDNIGEDLIGINEDWGNEDHILKKLFDDAKKIREQLLPSSINFENEFLKIRNEIQELHNESNLEELKIDSTMSDVFGTTTMEGQEESEEEIITLVTNKKGKITLLEKEAKNILNGFDYVSKKRIYPLDINEVKNLHGVLTEGLDEDFDFDGLKYQSKNFRNEIVNIGLFRDYTGEKPVYTVPLNSDLYINELFNFLNSKEGDFHLIDISIFHLFFYSTHPFWNGNKRTTRIVESGLIQQFFDKDHLTLGMGYYFRMNKKEYFTYIKSILSGQIMIESWILYYMKSFVNMGLETLKKIKEKKYGDIKDYVNDKKKYSYDEVDDLMFNFYVKNIGNEFTKKELKKFLKNDKKLILNNFNQIIDKKIEKHINDGLITERGFLEKRYRVIFHKKNKKEL